MKGDWLEQIELQMDESVPYYVPILISEIRLLQEALEAADKRFDEAMRIVREAVK
jgi:hypothetical protein